MRLFMRLTRFMCLTLVMCIGLTVSAQEPDIKVNKSGEQATSVKNNKNHNVTIYLHYDNNKPQRSVKLASGESCDIEADCYKIIGDGKQLYSRNKRNESANEPSLNIIAEEVHTAEESKQAPSTETGQGKGDTDQQKENTKPDNKVIEIIPDDNEDFKQKGWQKKSTILTHFKEYLEGHSYYGSSRIEDERSLLESYLDELAQGVADTAQIHQSIAAMTENYDRFNGKKDKLIGDFLDQYNNNSSDKIELRDTISKLIDERLEQRSEILNSLKTGLTEWEAQQPKHNWPLIGLIAGIVALGAGLVMWLSVKTKRKSPNRKSEPSNYLRASAGHNPNDIVVRRKTTSILKKQSLENVIDNPCYLAIDCADFCPTSAVRRIYIKNSCIKDIYNMYAEDLRNPENPKEDGCMVLGRWVHDKENNEYYVSLEEVVKPGDDAVFSEYELNFGGKIKLKVSEKLRKLRRETDLQYDMTCWVHSHPGLGVFFSNQDNTVHMQLKHPTHPHFLTALVIDILTPEQEMGIFTFKPDGTLNSKADLTKMYSLEDMYKWAIESDRNTFKREDHFDVLSHAKQHENTCHGVHLSNSAIIDIDKLTVEHENGMAGMVHGFIQQEGHYSEIAVSAVCHEEKIPDNELVGCFIITKYCSIPTVRRAIEPHADKIRFALVYSTADGLLTTIPVKGRELLADETYYGEQKLEELKIWTRRKR